MACCYMWYWATSTWLCFFEVCHLDKLVSLQPSHLSQFQVSKSPFSSLRYIWLTIICHSRNGAFFVVWWLACNSQYEAKTTISPAAISAGGAIRSPPMHRSILSWPELVISKNGFPHISALIDCYSLLLCHWPRTRSGQLSNLFKAMPNRMANGMIRILIILDSKTDMGNISRGCIPR